MYPHERSLVKQLANKPFALIGVNSDDDLEEIRKVVDEKKLTWRSFQNEGGEVSISDQWKIQGWPTVYIIDAEGKIRAKGPSDEMIEKCLAELGHKVEIQEASDHDEDSDEKDADEDANP